jgi:hypothetical protein
MAMIFSWWTGIGVAVWMYDCAFPHIVQVSHGTKSNGFLKCPTKYKIMYIHVYHMKENKGGTK